MKRRDTSAAGLVAEFEDGDGFGLVRGVLVGALWLTGIVAVFWLVGYAGM